MTANVTMSPPDDVAAFGQAPAHLGSRLAVQATASPTAEREERGRQSRWFTE